MTTISTALIVTDVLGTGGTRSWDCDEISLRDLIAGWLDMAAPADDDGSTVGDMVDAVEAAIRSHEYSDDLEAAVGIRVTPADDAEDAE